MNKYKLRMKTPTGLGNEYVYVYATTNFERYLNVHKLKYARDITKDYQLTDRFEELQQENARLKDKIERSFKIVDDKLTNLNLEYGVNNEFREEYDELWEILKEN